MRREEASETPRKSKQIVSVVKHMCFMGMNSAADLCFSNTGCCLEIDEYIQSSGCLLVRVEGKGAGKEEYG